MFIDFPYVSIFVHMFLYCPIYYIEFFGELNTIVGVQNEKVKRFIVCVEMFMFEQMYAINEKSSVAFFLHVSEGNSSMSATLEKQMKQVQFVVKEL